MMGERDDITVMRGIVPAGEKTAGLILPVVGILPFAVNEEVILDKQNRSVNEADRCHKRHGRAIAPEFGDSVVSDNVCEFADGVIKHRSALSAGLANTPCLPEQIAMP